MLHKQWIEDVFVCYYTVLMGFDAPGTDPVFDQWIKSRVIYQEIYCVNILINFSTKGDFDPPELPYDCVYGESWLVQITIDESGQPLVLSLRKFYCLLHHVFQ